MKKSLFLVLSILLASLFSALTVYSVDFQVDYVPVDDVIKPNETAAYTLNVKLTSNESGKVNFIVFTPDIEWLVNADPYLFTLDNLRDRITVDLKIKPSSYIYTFKTYGIVMKVQTSDGKNQKSIVLPLVYTSGNLTQEYNVDVIASMEVSERVSPVDKVTIKIPLKNQNRLDVSNLTLKIATDIKGVSVDSTVDLKPLESKILEYSFDVDDLQTPGNYPISFVLLYGSNELARGKSSIEVVENRPSFAREDTEEETWFTETKTIRLTNNGNIVQTQKISVESGSFENKFTDVSEGGVYEDKSFVFDVTLNPGESKEITVFVSYRSLATIVFIVLILVVINYVFLRHPVVISKKVADIDEVEGLKELKVQLNIRNNSNKVIRKVIVHDFIPRIGKYKKADELSEMPKKETKGVNTDLSWTIEDLDPKEERLISYKIHTKLPVLGTVQLERAKAVIFVNNQEKPSYSNAVKVSEKEIKEEKMY